MKEPQDQHTSSPAKEQLSGEALIAAQVKDAHDLLDTEDLQSLRAGVESLQGLHPADQGEALIDLDPERQSDVMTALDPAVAAKVLEEMEPEQAAEAVSDMDPEVLAVVLDETRPEVAADILHQLPLEQSRETQDAMSEIEDVVSLLQYDDETAGGLMTPEYPVVRDAVTAGSALDVLRLLGPQAESVSSLFVVESDGTLVDSLGIITLALARPNSLMRDIMSPTVATVSADTDQEECARLMQRYSLNQLPVVDADHRLVGVILGEEAVDVVEEEATEDMFSMVGMGGERLSGPLLGSVRHRLPWLFVNLATTVLAATVISLFESTIARVAVLAAFLPVVAGQGGIGGTQTLTLVVRSMALGGLPRGPGLRVLGREVALGVIHGLFLGAAVGLVGYAWQSNYTLGLILAAAMLGNMVVAGLAGAGVPLLLRRLKLDPAVASAVFVTTFTDVLGFLFFLGLAAILVERLE